jgi:rod shape-determining protein MreD
MRGTRAVVAVLLLMFAVTAQMSVLPHVAIAGVTCDLVLIVVVALGLSRGPEFGALAGFGGGLLLDVVPPADHAAGRWALACALAGYVAGVARRDAPLGPWAVALTQMLCTTLALTVFAVTGSLLRDPSVDWSSFGARLGIAAGYDVLAAVLVVPVVMWTMRRLEPARERRGLLP